MGETGKTAQEKNPIIEAKTLGNMDDKNGAVDRQPDNGESKRLNTLQVATNRACCDDKESVAGKAKATAKLEVEKRAENKIQIKTPQKRCVDTGEETKKDMPHESNTMKNAVDTVVTREKKRKAVTNITQEQRRYQNKKSRPVDEMAETTTNETGPELQTMGGVVKTGPEAMRAVVSYCQAVQREVNLWIRWKNQNDGEK